MSMRPTRNFRGRHGKTRDTKTPASTIKTMAWAASKKDSATLFASLSPDCQEWFKQMVEKKAPGAPPEQFLTQMWS